MYSRSPVLLVETQIQQTGSSGGVPSCSMRWSADNNPVKENRLYSCIYARFLVPLHIERTGKMTAEEQKRMEALESENAKLRGENSELQDKLLVA